IFFLVGIAINDWQHASGVLLGSIVGALVGSYHASAAFSPLDPESLIARGVYENAALGLYGDNPRLSPVDSFPWSPSTIPPLRRRLLAVLLTRLLPLARRPALLAACLVPPWPVLGLGWLDERLIRSPLAPSPRDKTAPPGARSVFSLEPPQSSPWSLQYDRL